jgi:branched-chain amino acid transport system ATP-binding protein
MRLRQGTGAGKDQAPLPEGSPLLQLHEVCASYSSYRALFGVSFEVKPAAIVALLGSNGAGKSTVARVVSGLVTASSGRITFNNQDIAAMPAFKIARLGMVHVPEGRGIFSSLSVEENLLLSLRQRLPRANVPAALEQAYTAFPILADRKDQIAGTLSGGQQRILALSRVLATPPRLLIVDELSLGLAPAIVDNVYETLVKIRETGCAVLVVEQQVDRALAIADHAVLLSRGLVAWSGPASEAAGAMDRVLGGRSIIASSEEAPSAGPSSAGAPSAGAPSAVAQSEGAQSEGAQSRGTESPGTHSDAAPVANTGHLSASSLAAQAVTVQAVTGARKEGI